MQHYSNPKNSSDVKILLPLFNFFKDTSAPV